MTPINESKVLIGGNVYTLSGNESEEYLQRVALYINKKMDEVRSSDNGKSLNTRLQSVLLAINIADDYYKMKVKNEEMQASFDDHDKEINHLKALLDNYKEQEQRQVQRIEQLEEEIERYKKELDDYIELFEDENE